MTLTGFRVAQRTDPDHPRGWGLWSDEHRRWLDVIYATEREATDMLGHLLAAERRREPLDRGKCR